ncbi:hypothetical protein SAMD00019534_087610 [Acytostelium subglobosum LB1]|uniref:hypothetical protein n=1 Tax=Acytostelium subglobosum LB1 TaxID=1410327 RepID=UPI000644FCC1|nr:hypothetical protein SAMD00019534_087610 [Acytostelium subglobosum LB1]GAM25586.1 hypothetical protein SAMD00019534_087610 [Acytostelium subglobosum LB1]|eukprot:XP_012751572.1 hypothetical protein SAMD00019534_087610 [Acytostelium subglobosum LB1]
MKSELYLSVNETSGSSNGVGSVGYTNGKPSSSSSSSEVSYTPLVNAGHLSSSAVASNKKDLPTPPTTGGPSSQLITTNRKTLHSNLRIMGLLGIANLAFSFYLAFGNIESGTCDISSTVSCTAVIKSSFGQIMNVPVSIFGITWNIIFLMGVCKVMMDDRVPQFLTALYIWCSLGIGFVLYFVAAEFIIGALCPFCTIVHIINITLMYFAFKLYTDLRSPPSLFNLISTLKSYLLFVFVVHMIVLIAYQAGAEEQHDEWTMSKFSQCLTEHNMVFYGSSRCGACVNQKQMFMTKDKGEADSPWKYVTFVECKDKHDLCTMNDIQRYPTWIKHESDGGKELERHEGVMNMFELSKMSGCQYKKEEIQE